MSIGDFPESSSQAIVVGIILVGRLGRSAKLIGHPVEHLRQSATDPVVWVFYVG